MADQVRACRARYQVMGIGKDGIVLDTDALPEDAIKYRGPHQTAVNMAEGFNNGHRALTQERLHSFEEAWRNTVLDRGDER